LIKIILKKVCDKKKVSYICSPKIKQFGKEDVLFFCVPTNLPM
jgi:hypothetical protein